MFFEWLLGLEGNRGVSCILRGSWIGAVRVPLKDLLSLLEVVDDIHLRL